MHKTIQKRFKRLFVKETPHSRVTVGGDPLITLGIKTRLSKNFKKRFSKKQNTIAVNKRRALLFTEVFSAPDTKTNKNQPNPSSALSILIFNSIIFEGTVHLEMLYNVLK